MHAYFFLLTNIRMSTPFVRLGILSDLSLLPNICVTYCVLVSREVAIASQYGQVNVIVRGKVGPLEKTETMVFGNDCGFSVFSP
jgi:hypothetical protein